MASRDIKDLIPEMQPVAQKFLDECKAAGIDAFITCTARTVQEQMALYAQGRQSLDEINKLRKVAGMPPISVADSKKKVTWTMASKHLVNWDNSDPNDDKSFAFDFALKINGKVTFDLKANVNKNDIPDYKEAAMIGERLGLVSGMRFKNPDYPHLEWKG